MTELTSRGFDAPTSLPDELGHKDDHFLIVRLTPWELRQVRVTTGQKGMRLLRRDDGTWDGIRYPPDTPQPGSRVFLTEALDEIDRLRSYLEVIAGEGEAAHRAYYEPRSMPPALQGSPTSFQHLREIARAALRGEGRGRLKKEVRREH